MKSRSILTSLITLTSLTLAIAHGDGHGDRIGHPPASNTTGAIVDNTSYYFAYEPHKGWLYLHFLTMILGWVIFMPIASMLSIAGSRLHTPAQIVFLLANVIGTVFAVIYNSLTPDLYPGNLHHKLGWALFCILGAQAMIGVAASIIRRSNLSVWGCKGDAGFVGVPTESPIDSGEEHLYRRSEDSGPWVSLEQESTPLYDGLEGHEWNTATEEKPTNGYWMDLGRLERFLSVRAPLIFNSRAVAVCDFVYSAIARFLIPLAFTQISSGVITGSGIFMGSNVFNGLAHFIKGGIFFIYGIFTIGRWLGAFAELGWAWNIKPNPSPWSGNNPLRWIPSEEAVTSSLIFVYGCTNIFLEHLAGWGSIWSHGDLQHVSIAFMFIGGGLLGLLIESRTIRELLNPPNTETPAHTISFNPLPALTIFFLGLLMSQHHQSSHLSTTIHTQWGALLAAAALFRMLTYLVFFRASPSSVSPSRPPTELVVAFCLVAGGLIFMASNKDTVEWLERVGVDAMFSLTVTVGMSALLLCWVVGVMAVKGWSIKRERRVGAA